MIHRDGPINALDDPAFVAAIKATGRWKLVIAACTTGAISADLVPGPPTSRRISA